VGPASNATEPVGRNQRAMSLPALRVDRTEPAPEALAAVAAVIRRGGTAIVPTESLYEAVRLVEREKEAGETPEIVHATSSWPSRRVPPRPAVARLVQRFWPGPLRIDLVRDSGSAPIRLRCPAHPFIQALVAEFGDGRLSMHEIPGAETAAEALAAYAPDADERDDVVLCDGGKAPLATPTAIASWSDETGLQVVRAGVLSERDILRAAARVVVFVCTGNTCRSPMAAALARRLVSDRLGIPEDRLADHGIRIGSAGLSAADGAPASEGATRVGQEIGLDLTPHRSWGMTHDLLESDLVFGLSEGHVEAMRQAADDPSHIDLLDPDGVGIADPFGGDLESYRAARDQILSALDRRGEQLVALFTTP
jgi:L-threonylcarbamoyladenylate synthase